MEAFTIKEIVEKGREASGTAEGDQELPIKTKVPNPEDCLMLSYSSGTISGDP